MSSKIFSYETLVHALSGVCGSCVAMTLVIPLDTVRTRMILDETKKSKKITEVFIEILKEEGPLGWVRGGLSTIQAVAASNFIYFYTFHGLKKLIPTSEQSALKDLLFSCCAGAMNVLITNPLWVVNTRMKTQDDAKLKGLVHGLFRIGIKEGLGSLWNGTGASLILVSNPALKFTTYEYLKRIFYGNSNSPSPSTAFFMGAFASVIATIITYPVQIVQTNLRQGQKVDMTFLQMFRYIIKNFGPYYLYKGIEAKLLQSIVTAGFMFLTYEKIMLAIFSLMGQRSINSKS